MARVKGGPTTRKRRKKLLNKQKDILGQNQPITKKQKNK